MEKAIIYNRVSTAEQNPELQLRECEEFCKNRDWEIIDRIQEKESAFKDDSKREKFQEMIKRAEQGEFNHIVVWNMDRFSRQHEEEVLKLVKKLNLIYRVDVYAVNGDLWSEVVQSIGIIKDKTFIGEAFSEFIEKIIRGLEFQRAHRESQVKSERIKLAVRKETGKKTKSYKGNKWGRKNIMNERLKADIFRLKQKGLSLKQISEQTYYYKSNNKVHPSISVVWKVLNHK